MRSIWGMLCLTVGLLGFAIAASAQNGLQRFESEVKPQIELKKFTYGSASALGLAGFVLNDVEDKECYGIKREGDVVTLTDAKGKGYRMTMLPGNPKNL